MVEISTQKLQNFAKKIRKHPFLAIIANFNAQNWQIKVKNSLAWYPGLTQPQI